MSSHLFQKLEEKVEQAIEAIDLLRLQLEESELKNSDLQTEVNELRSRQRDWEQHLSSLVQKLASTDFSVGSSGLKMKQVEEAHIANEEMAV